MYVYIPVLYNLSCTVFVWILYLWFSIEAFVDLGILKCFTYGCYSWHEYPETFATIRNHAFKTSVILLFCHKYTPRNSKTVVGFAYFQDSKMKRAGLFCPLQSLVFIKPFLDYLCFGGLLLSMYEQSVDL